MAKDLLGSGTNGGLVSQVESDKADGNIGVGFVDFRNDRLNLALGAAGENDELGLASGEEDCGLTPETTLAGTGDENYMHINCDRSAMFKSKTV